MPKGDPPVALKPAHGAPSASPEDIMARVRHETASEHQRLESQIPISSSDFDLAAYIKLLTNFWSIYRPLEARLSHLRLPPELQTEHRSKLHLLEKDLHLLAPQSALPAAMPACLPAIDDLPQALGCMYVMEGSTLGGQIICRIMQERFGLTREHGCAFFSSYGAEVGTMWKKFSEQARWVLKSAGDQQRFIETAKLTFHCFEQWLTRGDYV